MSAPAVAPSAASWKPAVLDAAGTLLAGRLYAANRAPYYRAGLFRLVPEETPGLDTVAVTERGRLLWDATAIMRWSKQPNGGAKIGGAMAHEVLHVLLNHAKRARDLGAVTDEQRKVWNEAADLAINVILRAGGWELPEGALYPEAFKLPPDLTAEGYYAALNARPKPPPSQPQGGGKQGDPQPGGGQGAPGPSGAPNDPSAGPQSGGSGDGPKVGGGWCGSCAGRPVPGEPPPGSEPQPGDATDAELEAVRRAVASEVQKANAKKAGSVPAELARWADEVLAPPRVRWQAKLERATRNGIGVRSGVQDYTRSKPARRQWGIGVGVGRPVVAAMFSRKPRVAFAIDTSASMGAEEIRTVASEVQGVLRALGYPLEFYAADAKVHTMKQVARVEDMVGAVVGGGGTDFRPVFADLERKGFEGVLIYGTDGFGPAPAAPPRGVHVVWLLVGATVTEPAPWGEVVRVDE